MIPRSRILPATMLGARLLPLVIAVNVYLAGMAVTGAVALLSSVNQWSGEIDQLVTVQIASGAKQDASTLIKPVMDVLRGHPAVASARPLSMDEIQALLAPWLGDSEAVRALPIPQLIDVSLKPNRDLDALRARLEAEFPGIMVDDHRAWRTRMASAMLTTRLVCAVIVGLIALAGILVIVFATRASLASHAELVALLHMIGARDAYVAGEFQKHFLGLGLRGALIGIIPAALTMAAIALALHNDSAPFLSRARLLPADYLLAALPAFAAALMTMLTARITVLRALAEMD